jgi:hypothetical protein
MHTYIHYMDKLKNPSLLNRVVYVIVGLKMIKNHMISIALGEFGIVEHILQTPQVDSIIISAIIFGKHHRKCKVS